MKEVQPVASRCVVMVASVKLSEMKLALCVSDHVPEGHKTRQRLDGSQSIYTKCRSPECKTALKMFVALPA